MRAKVAVSGGFDVIYPGHTRHLDAAMRLGDHLIVILSRDDQLKLKDEMSCKPAGKPWMTYRDRKEVLEWVLKGKGSFEVVENVDMDITSRDSLKLYCPDIFVKGGDTWDIRNLPELKVCEELGIKIVFGVGGFEKVCESRNIVRRMRV